MESLDFERIGCELRHRLGGHGAPLVVRGLFDDQPLGKIRTRREAIAAFGKLDLVLTREYAAGLRGKMAADQPITVTRLEDRRLASLASYLHEVERSPGESWLCTELETPPQVLDLAPFETRLGRLLGGRADLISNTFVGNAGNAARLHYDGDCRSVLLYQVFGSKRVTIIPADVGRHLATYLNFSSYLPHKMPAEVRAEFEEACGARSCTIGPGEAALIPMLSYHYVDYLTDSMSVNLRFGRPDQLALFAAVLPRSWQSQNVALQLGSASALDALAPLLRIVKAAFRPGTSGTEKLTELNRLFVELLPDSGDHPPPRLPEVLPDAFLELSPAAAAESTGSVASILESLDCIPRFAFHAASPALLRRLAARLRECSVPPVWAVDLAREYFGAGSLAALSVMQAEYLLLALSFVPPLAPSSRLVS